MAELLKTLNLLARSSTEFMGSNPTGGVDVCVYLFWVGVVLCVGSGHVTGSKYAQGNFPTVYRIKKKSKRRSRPK
jgi:hypothetical protein